jgi:hypothetical protein
LTTNECERPDRFSLDVITLNAELPQCAYDVNTTEPKAGHDKMRRKSRSSGIDSWPMRVPAVLKDHVFIELSNRGAAVDCPNISGWSSPTTLTTIPNPTLTLHNGPNIATSGPTNRRTTMRLSRPRRADSAAQRRSLRQSSLR